MYAHNIHWRESTTKKLWKKRLDVINALVKESSIKCSGWYKDVVD